MRISAHVTQSEFEHSDTAINYGLSNKMDSAQFRCANAICETIFEPLRKAMGDHPIRINSGFRSFSVNKRIGGSRTSQHMKGQALDLHIDAKAFHYIKDNLPFDQLIWEFGNDNQPQWVHVSYIEDESKARGQVLKAKKIKGKTTYIPYR